MNNILTNDKIITVDANCFDPDVTFDCGQSFRWEKDDDGSWSAVVRDKFVTVLKSEDKLYISGIDSESFDSFFRGYFDLDRDYKDILDTFRDDDILARALDFTSGIRILKQDPWEALCSFIISQNNNIPRIKGIIKRFCENFGEDLGNGLFTFPSAETTASLSLDDLAPLRSGFRAKYILDAARNVATGEVNLTELETLPLEEAQQSLMKIKGVGPKVADCALLFGCGRLDAFPIDVWIKKVLKKFYPDGFPEKFKEYGGIAQQYLFYYARWDESVAKSFN